MTGSTCAHAAHLGLQGKPGAQGMPGLTRQAWSHKARLGSQGQTGSEGKSTLTKQAWPHKEKLGSQCKTGLTGLPSKPKAIKHRTKNESATRRQAYQRCVVLFFNVASSARNAILAICHHIMKHMCLATFIQVCTGREFLLNGLACVFQG